MNALPLISHRVFVAAAGSGAVITKGRGRSKPGILELKNGIRSSVVPENEPALAPSFRASRSAAGRE